MNGHGRSPPRGKLRRWVDGADGCVWCVSARFCGVFVLCVCARVFFLILRAKTAGQSLMFGFVRKGTLLAWLFQQPNRILKSHMWGEGPMHFRGLRQFGLILVVLGQRRNTTAF